MIKDHRPTIFHSRGEIAGEEAFHAALKEAFVQYRDSFRRRCVCSSTASS